MRILILGVIVILRSAMAFSTEVSEEPKRSDQKVSVRLENAKQVRISGKNVMCFSSFDEPELKKHENQLMSLANDVSPNYDVSIACYQCCVGEPPMTIQACKSFKNFKNGKDCNCLKK